VITEAIELALEEIRASFAGCSVVHEEDGQGGAYVTVSVLDFGNRFKPESGWIGFHLGLHYPASRCLPALCSTSRTCRRWPVASGAFLLRGAGLARSTSHANIAAFKRSL